MAISTEHVPYGEYMNSVQITQRLQEESGLQLKSRIIDRPIKQHVRFTLCMRISPAVQ